MTQDKLIKHAKDIAGEFKLSNDFLSAGSVAAALITDIGNIYTGICIDLACGIGFCAEHSAIVDMLKHRETGIEMIVAVNDGGEIIPPCGRCREMMCQVNKSNTRTKVIIGADKIVTLDELLPNRFL